MDPVTHALIGTNIAGLSGKSMSLTNAFFLGPTLASLAPDLDIVLQAKGDLAYLKNHRSFSHSFPGILLISGVISLSLFVIFGGAAKLHFLFLWTLAGAASHVLIDAFNSYGVKLLWPFKKKKVSYSILSFFDWFIILTLASGIMLNNLYSVPYYFCFSIIASYILFRIWIIGRVKNYLEVSHSAQGELEKVTLLPSTFKILSWHFLIETSEEFLVGEVKSFSFSVRIYRRLEKNGEDYYIKAALNSKLGRLFKDFTPHYHVIHRKEEDRHVVRFLDLRYYANEDFMHSGTIAFDENCCKLEEVFQPYHRERRVELA